METITCIKCDYRIENKPFEILLHRVRKEGGDLKTNKCPKCKENTLKLK